MCFGVGGVLKGLDKKSFTPILIGITKTGKWVALDENYPLAIKNKVMPTIETMEQLWSFHKVDL